MSNSLLIVLQLLLFSWTVSLQETTGHEPEPYRFLPRDVAIYRVAMGMAVFGSVTAIIYIVRMATGSVPAKEQ